jgi:prevent-host-death family protein
MTTADSCPTKCSTTRTVCHLRIATHVLVIPGQTVACRREPPSVACPNRIHSAEVSDPWRRTSHRMGCHYPWSPRLGEGHRGTFRDDLAVLVVSPKVHQVSCSVMCYSDHMHSTVSVRELRNSVSMILRRVETGERMTVTVDRRPVAEIVPLQRRRNVTFAEALAVASRHSADRGLLDQLRMVMSDTTDDL